MIGAVIFDLNGVFISSPKLSDRFRDHFGIAPEKFLPALKAALTSARLPHGTDVYTSMRPHLERWGVPFTRAQFFDFWFSAERVVPEMVTFAQHLRNAGVRVLVLSNNFRERSEYYAGFPFVHEAVDRVYYSWETGYVKSDSRAYQCVLDREGLRPEDVVFFDDQEENVAVATALGIRSFLFRGVPEAAATLRELGIG